VGEAAGGGQDSAAHRDNDVLIIGGFILLACPEPKNKLRVAGMIMTCAVMRLMG